MPRTTSASTYRRLARSTFLLLCSILLSFLALTNTASADEPVVIPDAINTVIPDASTNFITTWNTENPGSTNNDQITIPGTGAGYSYELYWEDTASSTINGTTTLITTSSYTLTFPAPGIYEVQASGTFPRIVFDGGGDTDKILTVDQWGDIAWTSMDNAFQGASNLRIPATDAPDLSAVTSMHQTFMAANSFNDSIEHWDVSNVTDFSQIFRLAENFNQPLNNWSVSNATNTAAMFWDAYEFNQPLNNWDVSKVTNMESLFNNARKFNQPLNNWNVSQVGNMLRLFRDTPFNQNLATWDVSSVTEAEDMFQNTILSQQNQDATLVAWAAQPLQPNVPFHLGQKSYSSAGAAAIETMRNTYNWTITEQYRAEYYPSENASLLGDNIQSNLNTGATTTSVTLTPRKGCTFVAWSDGNTDNPRQDVIGTDNLNVTAELTCRSNTTISTSAGTQRDRLQTNGDDIRAQAIEDRFLTTTSTPARYQPPATLEESLEEVKTIPVTINTIIAADSSPETKRTLITILLELVETLKLVMAQEAVVTE